MNIIISGYGRMGREIEKISISRGHKIIGILDNDTDWNNLSVGAGEAVVIDFSLPETATQNILRCLKRKLPIVSGTTGWHNQIKDISQKVKELDGSLFYAPNFSIGVNIFLRTNEYLARIMNEMDEYSVNIKETHHIHKLDSPSGTAIATAMGIIENSDRYSDWSLEANTTKSILIKAKRKGEVTGTHRVTYNSPIDSITLKHKAKNRSGFALGAVLAAEFMLNKKGVYKMNDLLDSIIKT